MIKERRKGKSRQNQGNKKIKKKYYYHYNKIKENIDSKLFEKNGTKIVKEIVTKCEKIVIKWQNIETKKLKIGTDQ